MPDIPNISNMPFRVINDIATASTGAQPEVAAAATGGTHKTLYGDPSRGEGLMNTMSIMKQLSASAQALVSSRNTSLQ